MLEFLEPLGVTSLHPAVLIPPAMEGLLADAELLDDLADRRARGQHGVGVTKFADDLFRCVSFSFHRESPGYPNRGSSGLSQRLDQFSGGRSGRWMWHILCRLSFSTVRVRHATTAN